MWQPLCLLFHFPDCSLAHPPGSFCSHCRRTSALHFKITCSHCGQTPIRRTSSSPLFSPYAIGLFLLQPPVSFSFPETLFFPWLPWRPCYWSLDSVSLDLLSYGFDLCARESPASLSSLRYPPECPVDIKLTCLNQIHHLPLRLALLPPCPSSVRDLIHKTLQ